MEVGAAGRFISTCLAHKALNSGVIMGFSRLGQRAQASKKAAIGTHLARKGRLSVRAFLWKMIITVAAAWPPEDSKEGDQKGRESRSLVLIKYVALKSSTWFSSQSDHKGQKREDRESRLPALSSWWSHCLCQSLCFLGPHIWNGGEGWSSNKMN